MRKLASIQIITEINPIPGADSIEVASVLGWKVVVKKGEFAANQLVVFFEVDSVLPDRPYFEFMRTKNFRLKTIKLRKQLSQGLLAPLTVLPEKLFVKIGNTVLIGSDFSEFIGMDVTETLGVTKYEPPVSVTMGAITKGSFPSYVPKTDETRIQAEPQLIDELKGLPVYTTEKVDGTSATFSLLNGELDVCSRNLSLIEGDNIYWQMFNKYLKGKESSLEGFAVQGEIAGPGIQKNRLGLKEHQLFVFNVYDIKSGFYLNFEEFVLFCKSRQLPMVKFLGTANFNFTLEELLELAKGKYDGTTNDREGIVIRPLEEEYSEILGGRMSVKVINNDFLLKEEE